MITLKELIDTQNPGVFAIEKREGMTDSIYFFLDFEGKLVIIPEDVEVKECQELIRIL